MQHQPLSHLALAALVFLMTGCISSGAAPVTAEEAESVVATPAELTGTVQDAEPSAFEKADTPCGDLTVIRPRGPSVAIGVAKDVPGDQSGPKPLLAFDCGNENAPETTL